MLFSENWIKVSPFGEPFIPKYVNEKDKLRNQIEYVTANMK